MKNEIHPVVDVIIPVYKPGKRFRQLIQMLMIQKYPVHKIIVMNTDRTYWDDRSFQSVDNLEVHHVQKADFDHGATRNKGVGYSSADIMVFMTDDAVPADENLINCLVAAFCQKGPCGEIVAEAYGHQMADVDCGFVERYTRTFNYPDQSHLKTKADLPRLGIKTYFASNACCAYDREIFQKQGGFITGTIFNEDMLYAAHTIQNGYAIAYAADARVVHSHNYTGRQQFRRNFDLAVSQADHPEIFSGVPSESEGIRLVKKTACHLVRQKKLSLIPYLVIQSGFKYAGYYLGKRYRRLPHRLVVWCSMNREYWKRKQ